MLLCNYEAGLSFSREQHSGSRGTTYASLTGKVKRIAAHISDISRLSNAGRVVEESLVALGDRGAAGGLCV